MKVRTLKQLRLNCLQMAIDHRGGVKNMVSLVQRGSLLVRVFKDAPDVAPLKMTPKATAPKLSPFVVARKKDDVVVGEFDTQADADDCIEKARKGKKAALYIMELVGA